MEKNLPDWKIKKISEELVEELKINQESRSNYQSYWNKMLAFSFFASIGFTILFAWENQTKYLSIMSYLWDVPFGFAVTGILVLFPIKEKFTYCDGSRVSGGLWKKIIHFVLAFVPMYSLLVFRLHLDPVKCLWLTPVSFVTILVYVKLMQSPIRYSKGDKMTIGDYMTLRDTQKKAGIDPDKLPIYGTNISEIKSMSVMDWMLLKRDMELAGYKLD